MMENIKIACIVVTYNRLCLLKKCLENLNNQTYSNFDIIVVNNNSTDGTQEWLSNKKNLHVINQENLGGAGGFYAGMKYAYEHGYDWIWMMDDDGQPDSKQLECLIDGAQRTRSFFLNALVCNINDKSRLSFGLVLNNSNIDTVEEAQKFTEIQSSINPFNGTLIHRAVIDKIGLIKKEMFVWGDEFDYVFRVRNAGFSMFTIPSAIHYHPSSRANYGNIIPFVGKYKVLLPPKKRREIKYRNLGYLHKNYYGAKTILRTMLGYSMYYLFRLDFIGFISFVRSYSRGYRNIF